MKLKTDNKKLDRFEINGNVYRVVDFVVDFKDTDIDVAKQLGFYEFEKKVVEEVTEEAAVKKTSKKKEVTNVDKSE